MRQATTLEARTVVKSVLGDKLLQGIGSTWTDKVGKGKTGERRVCMALNFGDWNTEILEYELNFWMKASGYTNEVTVRDSAKRKRGFYSRGLTYVRFVAQTA